MAPGTHGGSSGGAESFVVCCSSLNSFLGKAVQTAELSSFITSVDLGQEH